MGFAPGPSVTLESHLILHTSFLFSVMDIPMLIPISISQYRLGCAPVINNSKISMAGHTQMHSSMFTLHVYYGVTRAQLCTIPTAGPRLVKQLLSENCWFPWLRAQWILSFTMKLLKLSRVVTYISSACTLSVKTSPVTIPHSKGQNSILEEPEVLEQHRCLPYYLREWLWGFLGLIYIKCLEKCSAHSKHSSNISYHHCYGSPQSWSSRGE